MDGIGIYGSVWNHSLFFALFGSTLLVFLYLWKKGLLSMDEEIKEQMLNNHEEEEQ